jgi:phosphatidate cytidylyltransferase
MLRWRLLLGTLIIAALIGLFWLDYRITIPGAALLPLLVALVVLASQEILDLARAGGLRPVPWVVYGGSLLVAAGSWLPAVLGQLPAAATPGRDSMLLTLASMTQGTLLALGMTVLAAFCAEMARYEKPGRVTGDLAATLLGVVYVGLMLGLIVQLRVLWGLGALASLVIVVKMGDTGAYTVGKLIGRHKMSPTISPGKTWEGAAGALVFACLGSWITFGWLVPRLGSPFPPGPSWGWLVFGLLLGTVGMLSDLAESLLKRDVGRKDSSRWMPGFGGVLDVIDSLLLSAPVAYACWAFGLV